MSLFMIVVVRTAGISSIVVQFESVDQFRWPGWFSVACGIAYIVVFLLFFVERMPSCCKLPQKVSGDKEAGHSKAAKNAMKWRLPGLKQFLVSLLQLVMFLRLTIMYLHDCCT